MSGTSTSNQYVADVGRVRKLSRRIWRNELKPTDLLHQCLERIQKTDDVIQAWCDLYREEALQQAEILTREAEEGHLRGPLHGIPIGIKDLFDVEGKPTRAGSQSRSHAPPAQADAEVVSRLRSAGAILLGKTHTTEFAFYPTAPTRNPHAPDHTPGGSSSGSAAGVAAGMVPIALGTQTGGSVNRPAAFCGVGGFHPSCQLLSTVGVQTLSPTYDNVGCLGHTLEDAVVLFEALAPEYVSYGPRHSYEEPLDIVILEDPILSKGGEEERNAVDRVGRALTDRNHRVRSAFSPVSFAALTEHWTTVLEYEMGRVLSHLLEEPEGAVREPIPSTIRRGQDIGGAQYHSARLEARKLVKQFWNEFDRSDLFLFPAAPETAPKGLDGTGDPAFTIPWTTLGGPVSTIRAGVTDEGLPLGVLLSGHPGTDLTFASVSARLDTQLNESS